MKEREIEEGKKERRKEGRKEGRKGGRKLHVIYSQYKKFKIFREIFKKRERKRKVTIAPTF